MSYDALEVRSGESDLAEDLSATHLITEAVDLYRLAEESGGSEYKQVFDQKRDLQSDIIEYAANAGLDEQKSFEISNQITSDPRINYLDDAIGKIRNLEKLAMEVN